MIALAGGGHGHGTRLGMVSATYTRHRTAAITCSVWNWRPPSRGVMVWISPQNEGLWECPLTLTDGAHGQ